MKKLIKLLPVVLAMLMLFAFGAFAEETGEIPDGEQNVTEVVLPATPTNVKYLTDESWYGIELSWAGDDNATGYEICVKENGNWVFLQDAKEYCMTEIYGLLLNSKFEIGVRSYIEVDGERYYSEGYGTCIVYTSSDIPLSVLSYESGPERDGIRLKWSTVTDCTGYRLYVVKNGKWTKIKDIYDEDVNEYLYTDVEYGKTYRFGIKTFVKGNRGLKFSGLSTMDIFHRDVRIVKNIRSTVTASSVTLKWDKVEGARGYRIYMYQGGKWKALKTTTATSYKVTDLEASKKYIFKVRAYEKVDGKTVWYPYSKSYSVITGSKTVSAYRVKNLQKYFSDGDWYIKINNMRDDEGYKFNYIVAGKGENLFCRYDYGKGDVVEYLYLDSKEAVYGILDSNKTYTVLSDDNAYYMANSMYTVAEILKVQNVGKVTAKTTVFNGKSAVEETYKDTVYGFTKTYYFVKDKVVGVKVKYSDGTVEQYNSFSVTDTPSSSLFKVPSGYKKVK